MRAIGVPLRKWTLCLLLLCVSTWAEAQAANEVAASYADATAGESTTTHPTSTAVPLSKPGVRHFELLESMCPFRTINYITHTLPQQCAKTSWSAPVEGVATATAVEAEATLGVDVELAGDVRNGTPSDEGRTTTTISTSDGKTGEGEQAASGTIQEEPGAELETDSPLDNANFLSFEEWKMKNLAQVGQSPENVGQGRAAPSNQPARRRPVNVNALDSLGEEAEIELDFSGFGTPPEGHENGEAQARGSQGGATTATEADKKAAPSSWALSKDAGKTCKERFNYASFDCAATVLKTNKQAKSATSVLVENKDSYMLNVCSASNKFLIVELCDDILVDTVVLANYEFFSSMFRHFRVSVSDRYPVKMERWRTLATFEARNSREIQPFLITEPQIWARYLRIEFLTQYGNEFYCPLSLLRVHGTTMMEQFRREEEEARGVDDDVDLEVVEDVVKPAIDSGPIPPEEVPVVVADAGKETEIPVPDNAAEANSSSAVASQSNSAETPSSTSETSSSSTSTSQTTPSETSESHDVPPPTNGTSNTAQSPAEPDSSVSGNAVIDSSNQSTETASSVEQSSPPGTQATAPDQAKDATAASSQSKGVSNQVVNDTVPSKGRAPRSPTNSTASNVPSPPQQRPSGTSPTPPTPSTQESFFKSIHKRLLYLEANSTLSLQYIEEQSRILRDAFVKVEKRQLAKTEKFLDHLNSTVMQELKSFRMMYDQLWQSTVIEIESMKERQKSEMSELGTRLSLMADELVWQKRMAVVQSTLLLLCLGLVLFVRSGTLGGNGGDVPIVQQLGNKYSSFFDASSPPRSPPDSHTTRRRRTFRNIWRSDTSLGLSDPQSDGPNVASDADTDGARSPVTIEYRSPTPTTASALAVNDLRNAHMHGTDPYPPDDTDQAARLEVLETQSGPATPNGTRDSRPSWEEVDRAIDALKAEEEDSKPQSSSSSSAPAVQPPAPSSTSSSGTPAYAASRKEREKARKKRSPLRRAHSSYDAMDDGSEVGDSGSELFL